MMNKSNTSIYEGCAVSIYVYIRSNTVSSEAAADKMGSETKFKSPTNRSIWIWQSQWSIKENPAEVLDEFVISEQFKRFSNGVTQLETLGPITSEIHLVIGLGDSIEASMYPILVFRNETLRAVADSNFKFQLYIDEDISLQQTGLKDHE